MKKQHLLLKLLPLLHVRKSLITSSRHSFLGCIEVLYLCSRGNLKTSNVVTTPTTSPSIFRPSTIPKYFSTLHPESLQNHFKEVKCLLI